MQSSEAYERVGSSLHAEIAAEYWERVPEPYRDSLWGGYVETLAPTRPSHAAELASTLGEGTSRSRAFKSIATQWSLIDPVATAEWVMTLPRSRSRDAAISSVAHQLMSTDPEAGVDWFADMGFEGESNPHLHNALLTWMRKDRGGIELDGEATPGAAITFL